MFKIRPSLILVCLLTFIVGPHSVHAGCTSVLKSLFRRDVGFKNSAAMDFTQRISRIENFTNFLRKGKKNPDPALNIKIGKKIEKMHEYIFADNYSANEREWRTFFRTMEGKLIGIKRYKAITKILEENPSISRKQLLIRLYDMGYNQEFHDYIATQLKELKSLSVFKLKLEEEINTLLVDVGNNYQEYRMVRGSLEDLLKTKECNDICKKQVDMLLAGLGANSDKESLAHPMFFKGEVRSSIDELRQLLYPEPLFVLTKAKRERNAELKSFILSFLGQPQFVDIILGKIYKSNSLGKTKAVRFFRLIYDTQAKTVYFPKINKILFSLANAKANTQILKGVNDTVDGNELLITFARRADALAKEKWKAIKNYAEKFEKDFFAQMKAAEVKAAARGSISPTRDNTLLTKVAIFTVAGAGAYSYFYFDSTPSSTEVTINNNEIPIPGHQTGQSTTTDLGEVPANNRGVVPYHATKPKTKKKNTAREDVKVLLDGPEDEMIDQVTDVLLDSATERDPSSEKNKVKAKKGFFTKLWCSMFTCLDIHKVQGK